MLQYGFDHLDLYRVSAKTMANNASAVRVLEKLGFSEEGREREAVYWSNQRWDRLVFGILKSDFEAIQS